MKIAILGAGGRLGRALIGILGQHAEVEPFAREFCDITSRASIENMLDDCWPVDVVINAAAMPGVEACEADVHRAMKTNGVAPTVLATMCRVRRVKFCHFSSDYAVNCPEASITENTPVGRPTSIYALSKLVGEIGVLTEGGTVFRISSIYGVDTAGMLNCIDQFLAGRGTRKNPIQVLDQITTPTSVYAVAEAVWQFLNKNLPPDLYNMATSTETSKLIFAAEVMRRSHDQPVHIIATPLPHRPPVSALNSGKLAAHGIVLPSWPDDLIATLKTDGHIS